jgi:long-subunit acyl-CoA synthetase (AMP-forming)
MKGKIFIGKYEQNNLIEEKVNNLIVKLGSYNIKKKSLVALNLKDSLAFIVLIKVCENMDLVPVLLSNIPEMKRYLESFNIGYYIHGSITKIEIVRINANPRVMPNDVTVVCKTSGSTSGMPKLVAWTDEVLDYQFRETASRLSYSREDNVLVTVPLWNAYGFSILNIFNKLKINLILPEYNSPSYLMNLIKEKEVSIFESLPRIYNLLSGYFLRKGFDISSVDIKTWGCGGDILREDLSNDWMRIFNLPILDGYGLCEAGPNVALNGPNEYRPRTVGKPLEGTFVRIGENSEILVKTPSIMKGYVLENGSIDDSSINVKGWIKTGDIGILDKDGFLKVNGRIKNIVIINGFNVSLEEVEQVIIDHAEIKECIAVRVSNKPNSDTISLFYTTYLNKPLESKVLRKYCLEIMAPQQVPSKFNYINTIPLLPSGKYDRVYLSNIASKRIYPVL